MMKTAGGIGAASLGDTPPGRDAVPGGVARSTLDQVGEGIVRRARGRGARPLGAAAGPQGGLTPTPNHASVVLHAAGQTHQQTGGNDSPKTR